MDCPGLCSLTIDLVTTLGLFFDRNGLLMGSMSYAGAVWPAAFAEMESLAAFGLINVNPGTGCDLVHVKNFGNINPAVAILSLDGITRFV